MYMSCKGTSRPARRAEFIEKPLFHFGVVKFDATASTPAKWTSWVVVVVAASGVVCVLKKT